MLCPHKSQPELIESPALCIAATNCHHRFSRMPGDVICEKHEIVYRGVNALASDAALVIRFVFQRFLPYHTQQIIYNAHANRFTLALYGSIVHIFPRGTYIDVFPFTGMPNILTALLYIYLCQPFRLIINCSLASSKIPRFSDAALPESMRMSIETSVTLWQRESVSRKKAGFLFRQC